jgi:uncharacterized protein
MIEMYVAGIAMDARNGHPIVVLNDPQKRRALPIWIGMFEANAITRALDNYKPERPLTHDLLLSTIQQTGFKVKHIEINELASNTYFATIVLQPLANGNIPQTPPGSPDREGLKTIDARPSDAIALALRAKAPIFVAAQVVAEGTISADFEKDEEEAEEFKKFIDNLKASDFATLNAEEGKAEGESEQGSD